MKELSVILAKERFLGPDWELLNRQYKNWPISERPNVNVYCGSITDCVLAEKVMPQFEPHLPASSHLPISIVGPASYSKKPTVSKEKAEQLIDVFIKNFCSAEAVAKFGLEIISDTKEYRKSMRDLKKEAYKMFSQFYVIEK